MRIVIQVRFGSSSGVRASEVDASQATSQPSVDHSDDHVRRVADSMQCSDPAITYHADGRLFPRSRTWNDDDAVPHDLVEDHVSIFQSPGARETAAEWYECHWKLVRVLQHTGRAGVPGRRRQGRRIRW